jgi:peptidoglycan/xylan/chitin deacetylase (PgdA/CDA1 family)/glycosyltransferase involved in cell wall biosynthesis
VTGIAVIIPCFNLGRTVEETLASVHGQTRPAAEILVVDDGSTDPLTRDVLGRVAGSVSVVRTDNRGPGAARNLGVRLTSAPYVVRLDADDLLAPTYLERLSDVLDTRPDLEFVTCALKAFGDADYTWTPPPNTFVDILTRGGPHVSTMFRRTAWERVGGFHEALEGYEDQDFWLSIVESGGRGEVLLEPLLLYRVREGSRYQRAIQPERASRRVRVIGERHKASLQQHYKELLLEHERFLQDLDRYRLELDARIADLDREALRLAAEHAARAAQLQERGATTLDLGDLRRVEPLSRIWGLDRGLPLDRYYIERFLETHAADIRGRALEVKDAAYTRRYGADRVTTADVVDVDAENRQATVVADLTNAAGIASDTYDCFILTQTLHIVYDFQAVIREAHRILKPGGVLLCTAPAVSRINFENGGLDGGDYWRFVEPAVRRMFGDVFGAENVAVTGYGNVLACTAFLHGIAPAELTTPELDHVDPWFPVLYAVRAVKEADRAADPIGGSARRTRPFARQRVGPSAILMYHRIADLSSDGSGLSVRPDTFREHLRYLVGSCRVMSLRELAACAIDGQLPDRSVALTLDDGYLDALNGASPLLQAAGVPATFFVSGPWDAAREYHWSMLERMFLAGEPLPPELDVYGDGARLEPTGSPDERKRVHRLLTQHLYPLGLPTRDAVMTRLQAWSGLNLPVRDSHRMMTAAEIAALAARPGHDIGGHSSSHLALPYQPLDVKRSEIARNRAALEHLLGRPPALFSYPYGDVDPESVALVRDVGYAFAVTVEERPLTIAARPLLLPRFEVRECGVGVLAERLEAAFAGSGAS